MKGTMDRRLAIAGARMLAIVTVAASALAMLPESAAAQSTAAQRNAVRQHCRTDFKKFCPGVVAGQALLCLEANLSDLTQDCNKAVLAALGADPNGETTVTDNGAPPAPAMRSDSAVAPIVSGEPPRANLRGQRKQIEAAAEPEEALPPAPPPRNTKRTSKPAPVPRNARASEPPPQEQQDLPPETASNEKDLPPDALPPEATQGEPLPPEYTQPKSNASKSRRTKSAAIPVEQPAAPAPRVKRGPPTKDPLVRACWNELTRFCKGMRAGGGRELACLTKRSRNLSPQCWQAYRAAHARASTRR